MRLRPAVFAILLVSLVWMGACSSGGAPTATPTEVAPTETPTPEEPTPEYEAIPGAYLGIFYGARTPSLDLFESIGKQPAIRMFYLGWGAHFSPGLYNTYAGMGQITMVTWEYMLRPAGDLEPYEGRLLEAIVDGVHDDHIRMWAEQVRDFGKPVLLRWGHEMNGDWYPWSGALNGGGATDGFGDPDLADGPERFVAAYRHIHDIFDQEGADNVLWLWCPNVPFEGLGDWNQIPNYYPGDAYVDWLCIDGYNWGTCGFGASFNSQWQSFDEVFGPGYAELQAINDSKPMIIGEYASTEVGGDKAAWITDAYERIREDYPQIRAVVWFHISKETDWRINSSPESLEAFKQAIAGDYWLEEWPGMR